jgi:hypothetical protein
MKLSRLLLGGVLLLAHMAMAGEWTHEELRRFKAAEANQGVAVDEEHFYAITNTAIGKYRKSDGERVAAWAQPKGGPLVHMNAGVVRDGKLYCAHSNYPAHPAVSSVEIFDTVTLRPVGSHSLGIAPGSLTWIAWHEDRWYACFAHYAKDKAVTGKDSSWTELVRYDAQWRREAGWVFPKSVVEKFGGDSASGGAFGKDGLLYITGHTLPEMYVLRLPAMGSVLENVGTIAITAQGQAFTFDPADAGMLYSIQRRSREVIVSRIRPN